MGTKIWEIEFGWNYENKTVVAEDVVQAIAKAWDLLKSEYGNAFKKETKEYWIRKAECIAESDE